MYAIFFTFSYIMILLIATVYIAKSDSEYQLKTLCLEKKLLRYAGCPQSLDVMEIMLTIIKTNLVH